MSRMFDVIHRNDDVTMIFSTYDEIQWREDWRSNLELFREDDVLGLYVIFAH